MLKIVAIYVVSCTLLGCGAESALNSSSHLTLTLDRAANGTLTANPAGQTFVPGTVVSLNAIPNARWTIESWSGTDDDASTSTVNAVTMNANRTVTVQFAQQDCAPDRATGNVVARMISPVPGATLPTGAVTFRWCNANADYVLSVETLPGAHDIFFGAAGGTGPAAGVRTVTIGPGCAASQPTGCIPPRGQQIYVTLYTLQQGRIVAPSPFQYTYTAGSSSP